MPAELVDVEITRDGKEVQAFTSRLDVNDPSDREAFLRDMDARLGVSDPENYLMQVWRRRTAIGTFRLGISRASEQ